MAGAAERMAVDTLLKMAGGGVYDHLGGGFHRYSVDELWHVPHFEKVRDARRLLNAGAGAGAAKDLCMGVCTSDSSPGTSKYREEPGWFLAQHTVGCAGGLHVQHAHAAAWDWSSVCLHSTCLCSACSQAF